MSVRLILLAKEPVINVILTIKQISALKRLCFRCFHKSLMVQALSAIDNINVLIVPLKQQHWVGPDTHTHAHTRTRAHRWEYHGTGNNALMLP